MTLKCWVMIIPVQWFRSWLIGHGRLAAMLAAGAMAVSAQSLDAIADRYRKTPNATTRAAVLRYAEAHRTEKNGALALLLLGATEDDQRQFGDALTHLKAAAKRLPELADYVAYLSAVAEAGLRQFNDTEAALQPVWQSTPASALGDESGSIASRIVLAGRQSGGRSHPGPAACSRLAYASKPNCCWPAPMRHRITRTPPRSIIKGSTSSIR